MQVFLIILFKVAERNDKMAKKEKKEQKTRENTEKQKRFSKRELLGLSYYTLFFFYNN